MSHGFIKVSSGNYGGPKREDFKDPKKQDVVYVRSVGILVMN